MSWLNTAAQLVSKSDQVVVEKKNPYHDERGRFTTGSGAVDSNAPNFGLPKFPITVSDDDPLLQAIPNGPNGRETQNIKTPAREKMRAEIVGKHFAGALPAAPDRKPVAYMLGGGGASGKGTLLKMLEGAGEVPKGVVHVDPDEIKKEIPEYEAFNKRGDSRSAAIVHEESSKLAKDVIAAAKEGRYDMVLDRTLGNPEKARAEIKALREAGYEIRLYGVTNSPAEAVRRSVERAKKSNRWVPIKDLLTAHKGFAKGFESYTKEVDHARLYDTTVPKGTPPKLVGVKSDGKFAVSDKKLYSKFKKRRSINEEATTVRAISGKPRRDRRAVEKSQADAGAGGRAGGGGSGRTPGSSGANAGQRLTWVQKAAQAVK